MPSKYQYVHELWLEQSQHITSSPESWMTFLKTASWTYKYRFEDQILIYSQKPNARACADFDTWNQKMNRWIKKNTKGIALLNEKGHGLRYVFDISDTRSPTNKPLHLWNIQEEYYPEFIEMIDNKYGPFQHSSNDLGEILMKMAEVIAQDNCQDYLSSLVKYNRDSNLEYLEEHEIQTLFESLVSNTIAFEFINRCGLDTSLYFDEQDFYPITNFNSLDTIGQLGMTCHDLCEMGMQDISVKAREIMIRTFAKETQTIENDSVKDERSDLHENNHIQSSGRLPDSQSNGERTNSQQPLRTIKIPIPKEQSSGTFIRTESEESTQPTSQRNRSTSPRENGNNDATIISEVSSTEQRKQSNEMGSLYEQLEINSQRSNSQGDYQQLDLGFGLNDTGGDEQSLPPFNMDYLSTLLCTDIGLTKKKEDIVQYFKEHTDDEERTAFISECYDDTLIQTYRNPQWYDFNYIGYKKNRHGLDIWEGNYLNKKSSSFLSFMEIQSEISKLIDNYEYTLPNWDGMSGVQLAYQNKVFNKYALFQFMIYRAELLKPSSEIIAYFKEHTDKDEQAHFIQDCYPNHVVEWQVDGVPLGYVKNHEYLHLYYGTYDNQLESVDYTWSRVAYEIDGLILSRYYDPNVQIPTLEEQQNAVFENEESLRNGIFFSQEEIDRVLTRGSGFSQGKYRIYQQLQKHRSSKEKEAFLKHEYGIGGSSPAVGYISEDHDGKGITITRSIENRKDEIKVTLKWDKVVKRISELIASNRYLSQKELEYYPTYLQEQINNELDKERKQLESTQTSNQTEEIIPADVPKEYQWHMGDTVYIGISEYEIIQNNDTIVLQDKEFPLFNETYTPDELRKVLEENPLNDGLLVPIQEKETTKDELIQEYIPLFLDKIKRSSIYPSLRDRDTTIDEAQDLIASEMISIIGSINAEHREIYELYTSDEVMRKIIINDLIDKTYQDYSFSSIQETTMPHMLYQQLTQLNSRIAETKSALIVLYPRNDREYPLMLSYDDKTHTIDMFHFYEIDGIEVNEPFMTFKIDAEKQVLTPIYYENPLMNVQFDLNNTPEEQKEFVSKDMENYASSWLNNMIQKNYYIESEQLYKTSDHKGIYRIYYNEDETIKVSDMLYTQLAEFAKEYHYDIPNDYRMYQEIETIEDILSYLNIEDIEVQWDDEFEQIIAADEDNTWNGKEFYDFLLNEAIVYDDKDAPNGIPTSVYERLKDFASIQKIPEIKESPKIDYHIADEHLGAGTPKERYRNNIAAIKLLFSLEKQHHSATKEEQEILAKYVGWGGLADVFDESKSNWTNEYHELKDLLNEDEYRNARESTLTAFYTPSVVIESIYQILSNLGFRYGNILEPACGTGNFMGLVPESMKDSKMYGIELDSITGRIAKQLYQNANISIEGYEDTKLPDSFFDVAVGNVPFGQFGVVDKRYDKYHFNIHDYFFAKTLDKVRPGGIIAFVTSRFTMDKANSSVRKYISERAELLGAIRLPNNTFSESANTKAVSDILVLQKRDRPMVVDEAWLYTEKDSQGNVMNSYFVSHPNMILGNVEKSKNMYGREDLTVTPYEDVTLKEALDSAIQSIHGHIENSIINELELDSNEPDIVSIPANPDVRNYSYTMVDGDIYFRENSQMVKMELSKTAQNRITGLIDIRECVRKLIDYQKEDYPESMIESEQKHLNELYDTFTAQYGLINSRGNALAFREDSSYYLLCSLENINEDGTLKSKADMFTKRTIRKKEVVQSVETSQEALMLSLAEKATIDFDYMSSLTGFDKEKMINDLHGVIYKIPNVNEPSLEEYVTADEYLSGNIREKLKIAKISTLIDLQYQDHVDALTKAMPQDLSASEIEVRLGATWIDSDIYEQFMFEILSTSGFAKQHIHITYSKFTDTWNVSNKNWDRGNAKAEKTYGTHRANAYRLIEDCLNLKGTKIFDYEYDDDGKKVAILNKKETMIAQQKQDSIKDAFKNWIWKDFDRREHLTQKYNELFNSTRPREYNGDHLEFPNMNTEITLRKHQKDAIAHILYGNNVLLAHVVGAGKTYEMTAACMELKRLGISQKAMFVVPNHLIEQWGSEFLQLYPSANILVARKQDFEKSNRKKFCSRIATGDYDAIIIGHSMFEKIPVSIERQKRMIEEQIEGITQGIQGLRQNNGERYSIKQLEKTKKTLKKRLEKLNSDERKDDVVTFEELGVDRIFVDESHNYKNLFLYTKMRNVAGLSQTEAQKSSDLFMKCQYLDELTNGKGIVFATGTPISNSMTEMYTIQRYLQFDALKKQGLEHFDAWASTFGETISAIELAPEGTGYRMKTRFAKFYNLPELINMFKEVADIKTADMLNLPVPTAHYENISVKPSEMQKEIVESLADRAQEVRDGNVDPTQDNMLKITNDGRKLALEQRLINPLLPENEHSKVNACLENVFRIYEENKDKKSTQLIFCDMSTPSKTSSTFIESLDSSENIPYTNVYDDIAHKLIDYGIPPSEIAYIHDAATDVKKKELFSKVRAGTVRILLGSTQKMGAGTNVQDRLIAIHDLDCPWRPSDLEQRAGRIVRQGNQNSDVYIYRYVTEQTFDAYLYQLVENKQKFISQIMTSKSPVRSAEDIDEASLNYAEIKALASGNPKIKEKMDLDIQVSKLKLAKANYLSERYDLEDKIIKYYPMKIASIKERISNYQKDFETTKDVEQFTGMKVHGKFYDEKELAGNALLLACKNHKTTDSKSIGQYRDFEMLLSYDSFYNYHKITLKKNAQYVVDLGDDVYGNITRLDNQINSISKKLETEKTLLVDIEHQFENAKEEVNRPFEKEQELQEKSSRLSELNKELDIGNKDNHAEVSLDDETEEIESRKNEISR